MTIIAQSMPKKAAVPAGKKKAATPQDKRVEDFVKNLREWWQAVEPEDRKTIMRVTRTKP